MSRTRGATLDPYSSMLLLMSSGSTRSVLGQRTGTILARHGGDEDRLDREPRGFGQIDGLLVEEPLELDTVHDSDDRCRRVRADVVGEIGTAGDPQRILDVAPQRREPPDDEVAGWVVCLLYTSDAADDLTRVDLGGRRI